MDIDQLAKELSKPPSDFGWLGNRPFNGESEYVLYHTKHRDSDTVDRSNAQEIEEHFKDSDNVEFQHFGHWAVGWIDAIAIKLYTNSTNKTYTQEFKDLYKFIEDMEDYPLLNEEGHSQMEYDDAIETLENCYDIPDDKSGEAFSWLWDNNYYFYESSFDSEGIEEVKKALNIDQD